MAIETVDFSSSHLVSAMYDDETEELVITFHNGASYSYEVDEDVWEGLKTARSAGKYFHGNIK